MNVIITNANRPKPRKPNPPASGNEAGIPGQEGTDNATEQPAAPPKPDDTSQRIIKLVPAEVIAGYTALLSITASVNDESIRYAIPIALVACTVLIALVLTRAGKQHAPPVQVPNLQYVFSILAFLAWALAIRDPLDPFGYYVPRWLPSFGCVLIPLFGAYLIDVADEPEKEA